VRAKAAASELALRSHSEAVRAFSKTHRRPRAALRVRRGSRSNPSSCDWACEGPLQDGPTLLIILYDKTKRAPDSQGDFLGIIGLGCLMENIWLAAESLGIGVHVLSEFGEDPIDKEVKQLLKIPNNMNIAYALRLGYLKTKDNSEYPRVRRDISDFTHNNIYGKKYFCP